MYAFFFFLYGQYLYVLVYYYMYIHIIRFSDKILHADAENVQFKRIFSLDLIFLISG